MEFEKFTVVISGVGGQGLISLLQILGTALMNKAYHVITSETHGLAQRGGKVVCFLRFGNKAFSPLPIMGSADIIVATERSSALDVLKYAKPDKSTQFIISTYEKHVIGEPYPSEEYLTKIFNEHSVHVLLIPVIEIAQHKVKNLRTANIILLACLSRFLPITGDDLKYGLRDYFVGEMLETNLRALKVGLAFKKT